MGEREIEVRRYYPWFVTAQLLPTALLTAWVLDARISSERIGVASVWLIVCIPVLIVAYRQARSRRDRPEVWAIIAMATNFPYALWTGWMVVERIDPWNTALTLVASTGITALGILIPWFVAWIAGRRARRA
ncbi:hypothetical protein KIPE111705_03135 [Kibdelosporangium persicum]|uniref:Uncharacterized protein n=1 Tax=Kibdelosporangium persicum TaxID=2698649 RepID=A0ABX2F7W5_9PSEU|nr:hypothetical protein [Kibdelosporangium persicum]NRN67448.1 hypothetical protein [Kibdelosporangium persicum]